MKKLIIIVISVSISCFGFSQNNVGIGTTTPQAPFHVKTTTILEAARLEAPNPRLSFWNPTSFQGAIGTNSTSMDINTKSVVSGTALPITLSPGATTTTHFLANGNVGIGTATPQASLEVNKPVNAAIKIRSGSLSDTTMLIFSNRNTSETGTDFILASNRETGFNVSSTSDFAPYVQPSIMLLSPNGNVGIGNTVPQSKLDVTGDINVTGAIKFGGNPGTTGQVLTSGGTGVPLWINTALSNNIRFAATLSTAINQSSGVMGMNTKYNLNPGMIIINPTSISITTAGLYHFVVHVVPYCPAASAPFFGLSLTTYTSGDYELLRPHTIPASGSIYLENYLYNVDVYLVAGDIVQLPFTLSSSGTGYNVAGWLTGYLISE